ncbi:MAG: hypothetical protein KGI70_00305 [Patescibacteria group bacterium]|nr:hypothetical protein [Patescibacteria group bacterium]
MRERHIQALHESAAEFINQETNRQSMITVTGVRLNDAGTKATVLVTVFPEAHEERAIEFLNRRGRDFILYHKKRVKGMPPSHTEFVLDRGEKNRQRLDELTS